MSVFVVITKFAILQVDHLGGRKACLQISRGDSKLPF